MKQIENIQNIREKQNSINPSAGLDISQSSEEEQEDEKKSQFEASKNTLKRKRRQKMLDKGILLLSCLFHYSDIITDIYVTIQTYKSYDSYQNEQREVVFIRFLLMAFALVFERWEQFFSCKELMLFIQKKRNKNENYSLKIKDYALIFFQLCTFSDIVLYIETYKLNGEIFRFMFKKRLSDLCSENLIFFTISSLTFIEDVVQTNYVDFMLFISQFISFMSCMVVFVQLYFKRMRSSHKYREKKIQNLFRFPKELQVLIANPCSLQILKFNQNVSRKYIPYLKKSKKSIQLEQNTVSNLEKFVENMKNSDEKQNNNDNNNNFWTFKEVMKRFYVIVIVFCSLLSQIYLLALNILSEKVLRIKHFLLMSLVLNLPQIILYVYLNLKHQKLKNKLKFMGKFLLKLPVTALISIYQFTLPFPIYKIPFIEQTKEVWKYNLYPMLYMHIINLGQQAYILYFQYQLFVHGKYLNEIIFSSSDQIENALDPNKIIYKIYVMVFIVSILDATFKCLAILEFFYSQIKKKIHNNNDQQQQSEQSDQQQQVSLQVVGNQKGIQIEQRQKQEQALACDKDKDDVLQNSSVCSRELEEQVQEFSFVQGIAQKNISDQQISQIQFQTNFSDKSISILQSVYPITRRDQIQSFRCLNQEYSNQNYNVQQQDQQQQSISFL